MTWVKSGCVFASNNEFPWMVSHAANPFAVALGQNRFKVYFTSRDEKNRSHISAGVFRLQNDKMTMIELFDEPVLVPGELGLFDDSGVAMGYLMIEGDTQFLFYLGWNLKVTVPWLNTIGLAKSIDGGKSFQKVSKAPMMDRAHEDPFSISYPSIMKEGEKYRMWYGSNMNWGKTQDEMNHVIKYAESQNLKDWDRSNSISLDLEHEGEYALSKPFVLKRNGLYEMWYSYRRGPYGDTYRIGYATSPDGDKWVRKDSEVGINVSQSGWDSEMIEYPFIFEFDSKLIMLYNGNSYGGTGFGMASKTL